MTVRTIDFVQFYFTIFPGTRQSIPIYLRYYLIYSY